MLISATIIFHKNRYFFDAKINYVFRLWITYVVILEFSLSKMANYEDAAKRHSMPLNWIFIFTQILVNFLSKSKIDVSIAIWWLFNYVELFHSYRKTSLFGWNSKWRLMKTRHSHSFLVFFTINNIKQSDLTS